MLVTGAYNHIIPNIPRIVTELKAKLTDHAVQCIPLISKMSPSLQMQ